MANFDYLESDIMFPEHSHQDKEDSGYSHLNRPPQMTTACQNSSADVGRSCKKMMNYSLPVCIPERDHFEWVDEFETEDCWGREKEVVPPHLIVARRVAWNMEFSVCSGKGRTLKGRDLRKVRNEILRMTGFLEAN